MTSAALSFKFLYVCSAQVKLHLLGQIRYPFVFFLIGVMFWTHITV